MTNSSDRLDRIEALAEENERKISALINIVTAQQQQIDNQQQQIAVVATAVQQSTENITQIVVRQDQVIASINAELERQGRILDYLLGQQRQDENPN